MKNEDLGGGGRIPIFIVVVNDTLRGVVHKLVEKSAHLTLCGQASSMEEALEKIGSSPHRPAVVLVDIFTPDKDVVIICHLKKRYPGIHILAISGHDDPDTAFETITAGAEGYLLKEELAKLEEVVARVIEGYGFISEKVQEQLDKGK